MTKYYDDVIGIGKEKGRDPGTPIAIDVKGETEEQPQYLCSICNTYLKKKNDDDNNKEWICLRCQVTFLPEYLDKDHKLRTASRIRTPRTRNENPEPLVAYPPDPMEGYFNEKKIEPKGGFAELQKKGIRITSYNEYNPT